MSTSYDLISIGTGAVGSITAQAAADAGWKVAIIDNKPFGGTCAVRGCNPKKAMIGAAEMIDGYNRMRLTVANELASQKLAGAKQKAQLNWEKLKKFKDTFVEKIPAAREKRYAQKGIDTFHGTATFIDRESLRVGDIVLSARHFVIGIGVVPRRLGIPGEEHLIESDDFFELPNLPKDIIFLGAGYISMEFANIALRCGSRVHIINHSERALRGFDEDMVKIACAAAEEAGMQITMNTVPLKIEKRGKKLILHARENEKDVTYTTDMIFNGIGRIPPVKSIKPEKAGITINKKGEIEVNEYLQTTGNPNIYSGGDCAATARAQLSPTAKADARIIANNLLNKEKIKPHYGVVPSVAFTIPAIASVGMTEQEAEKSGHHFKVNFADIGSWNVSRYVGETHGGFKILIEDGTHNILGAHLCAYHMEELINIFAIAINNAIPASKLSETLFVFPTTSSNLEEMLEIKK